MSSLTTLIFITLFSYFLTMFFLVILSGIALFFYGLWFFGKDLPDYKELSKYNPNRIIDIRYSMLPNEIHGLWGIEIEKNIEKNQHVKYFFNRENNSEALKELWSILIN